MVLVILMLAINQGVFDRSFDGTYGGNLDRKCSCPGINATNCEILAIIILQSINVL